MIAGGISGVNGGLFVLLLLFFKMDEVRLCLGGGGMKVLQDLFWLCEVVKLGGRVTLCKDEIGDGGRGEKRV